MSKYSLIKGQGPGVVEVATSACVRVKATGTFFCLVEGVILKAASFRLDEAIDRFEIVCDPGVHWNVEWLVPKPGYEMPDPTPIALPAGATRPETLAETIARMVRHQVNQGAASAGFDLADEEDFDDDDDEEPTPYEFEEIAAREERKLAQARKLRAYAKQKRDAYRDRKPRQEPTPAEPTAPPGATGSKAAEAS